MYDHRVRARRVPHGLARLTSLGLILSLGLAAAGVSWGYQALTASTDASDVAASLRAFATAAQTSTSATSGQFTAASLTGTLVRPHWRVLAETAPAAGVRELSWALGSTEASLGGDPTGTLLGLAARTSAGECVHVLVPLAGALTLSRAGGHSCTASPTPLPGPISAGDLPAPRDAGSHAGDHVLVLRWGAPTLPAGVSLTGFQVQDGTGHLLTRTPAATLTATIPGLTAGVPVDVDVLARTSAGLSAPLHLRLTPTGLPRVPAGFTAFGPASAIALAWAPSPEPGVTGYVLRRDGVVRATLSPTTLGFRDTLPDSVRTARYELRVRTGAGESPPAALTWMPPARLAPPVLTSLVSTPHSTSLAWAALPAATDGFEFTCAAPAAPGVHASALPGADGLTLAGLTPATHYTCTLAALAGSSRALTPVGFDTPIFSSAPAGLRVRAVLAGASPAASLSWELPSEVSAQGFELSWPGAPVRILPGDARATLISGLTAGAQYTFSLRTRTTPGPAGLSAPTSTTLVLLAPPAPPTALTPRPVLGGVALSWVEPAPAGAPVTGFLVFLDGASTPLRTLPAQLRACTLPLPPGVHTLTLQASSAAGSSDLSAPVSVAALPAVPTPGLPALPPPALPVIH